LVIEVADLSPDDGVTVVSIGDANQDDSPGFLVGKVGALSISSSKDSTQDGAIRAPRLVFVLLDVPSILCSSSTLDKDRLLSEDIRTIKVLHQAHAPPLVQGLDHELSLREEDEDPMRDLGRLQNELWRAVRLVVDTGLHSKKWTIEDGIEYFRENTPLSEGDIKTEVERYLVVPGQALSYKIGMLKILELRAKARKALGDKFDIPGFHDAVLSAGALPLPILERVVDAYIARVDGC